MAVGAYAPWKGNMGDLAKFLAQPTAPEVPAEYSMDGDGNYTRAYIMEKQPATPDELLDLFGHDKDRYAVDGSVSVSHRELVDGRIVSTYRYKLRERPIPVDVSDTISRAKKAKKHKDAGTAGGHWFVVHSPDLQIGKLASGYGTEGIIEQFLSSMRAAVDEYRLLRRKGVAGVLLAFAGDCLEGVTSQGGKNLWLTTETMAEQHRIFRRLLMAAVELWAPLTDDLVVAVVNGNHDDYQRSVNTKPSDGAATECAIAVDDALKLNPDAYGHVRVLVPNEWRAHMTFPVGDSVVAMTHGHLFRPGKGMQWWAEQTFGKNSPGAADILLTGHYHTFHVDTDSGRTWIQGTTLDGGSDWYQDARGSSSTPGVVVFLLKAGRVTNMGVV